MKKVACFLLVCIFFMLRPYELQRTGMIYPTDDYGYFAHATALIYGQFPHYDRESFFVPHKPMASIGPALMAAPFVLSFSVFDRLAGSDITEQRTLENIPGSWSLFGFVLASNFYFCLGCFLLFKGLRYHVDERYAVLAVVFMALCQGLPVYALHRPVLSHVYEFFLQSLLVFLLLKRHVSGSLAKKNHGMAAGVGLLVGLLYLVRFNNILAAMVWPFVLFWNNRSDWKSRHFYATLLTVFGVAAALAFIFKITPDMLYPHEGYAQAVGRLTQVYPLTFYARRLLHILFGIDWGLIYTAPFIILSLPVPFVSRSALGRRLRVCLLTVIVNLYIIIVWRTQGGYYGYRYFVFFAMPLLVYPLATLLQRGEARWGKRFVRIMACLAIIPGLSMMAFEANPSNLALQSVDQYFGYPGAGNDTFQMEVWEMLLFTPGQLLIALSHGGVFYWLHIMAHMFGFHAELPNLVHVHYPAFSFPVFIKTCLLYACPLLLYFVFRLKGKGNA